MIALPNQMEVYPARLETTHVTPSDAELARIEAELESLCLRESAITLHDIEVELHKSLQQDDIDASVDGLKQLTGFKLLVNSITAINATRQDSLALVQEAKNVLLESEISGIRTEIRREEEQTEKLGAQADYIGKVKANLDAKRSQLLQEQ